MTTLQAPAARNLPNTVVLAFLNSQDRENGLAALAAFGPAKSIDIGESSARVVCLSQRGEHGAFRLHAIASRHGVPVHVE